MMANPFEILQRKKDFHTTTLLLSWKTKPVSYGLAQGAMPVFYDGKTFTVFKNKDGKANNGSIWFGALGLRVECIVMMERPSRTLKGKG
ncbi:MAG: hypothetical protein JWQ40_4829 [Segetibacter sp.]|nr:hypothetical protein [Segetibacter sp.]